MNKVKINYYKESYVYGEFIHNKDWFIFLDSCYDAGSFGTYDILTCNPHTKMTSFGNYIELIKNDIKSNFYDNPFDVIKKYQNKTDYFCNLPFHSGMIGYFGYDALNKNKPSKSNFPDIAVGFYDWAIVIDHKKFEAYITYKHSNDLIEDIISNFSKDIIDAKTVSKYKFNNFQQVTKKDDYINDVIKIKKYISDGDCYQVNYSQNFKANYTGDPWNIYKDLRKINPAPYSTFFNFGTKYIISSSPERFISINSGLVQTKPIKGTLKRLSDPYKDNEQKNILRNDEKNISENLMIVDLLRNDLSKCCELGSVKVTKLFEIESYASVHHMVSTIEGVLDNIHTSVDILEASFPGGSITGAPKARSMEIISELENRERGVYCGSIGYFDENGNMDTNICIRTIMLHDNELNFAAGGGIVHDSNPKDEYFESLEKVSIFIKYFSNGDFKW